MPQSPSKTGFARKAELETRNEVALRRQQYNLAVHIYASFVSLRYSDFPINISSAHLKELEILFDDAASQVHGDEDKNSATPFNDFWSSKADDVERGSVQEVSSDSGTLYGQTSSYDLLASPEKKHYSQVQAFQLSDIRDALPAGVKISEAFGADTFNNSERSIKELVLTNTWPKFVNAGHASSMQSQKPSFKERFNEYKAELGNCGLPVNDIWNRRAKKSDETEA